MDNSTSITPADDPQVLPVAERLKIKHPHSPTSCSVEICGRVCYEKYLYNKYGIDAYKRTFKCIVEDCLDINKDRKGWESHIKSHGLKPYVCKCKQGFTLYRTYEGHLAQRHGEEVLGVHRCPECGYIARFSSKLKIHIKRNHTGPIKCDIPECKFRFTNESKLSLHKNEDHPQSTNGAFKCEVDGCHFSFPVHNSLSRHYKICHLDESGSRPKRKRKRVAGLQAEVTKRQKPNPQPTRHPLVGVERKRKMSDDEMLHGNGHEAEIKEAQISTTNEGIILLSKSRNISLHEDLFEKYWTKPIKKRESLIEDPDNPPVDTMTELGPCEVTIGRYVFNVVMYAARDLAFRRLQTQHRPVIQYRPPPVKKLNVEEVMAKQASRDPEFIDLLKPVLGGNASTNDLEEDYVDTTQQATTATLPVNRTPTVNRSRVSSNVRKTRKTTKNSFSEDISAVIFEFIGGSGDRFLFPKYSILENFHEGHVTALFLVVRRGSSNESKSYNHELDYYEPFTIRLYTPVPEHINLLSKVVAPPDEVQKYIGDIMDNTTRGEYVLLATSNSSKRLSKPQA